MKISSLKMAATLFPRKRRNSLFFLANTFLWACLLCGSFAKVEESFVRIDKNLHDETISTISDGKIVVTAILREDGETLLDCHVMSRNSTCSKELFKEAVIRDKSDENTQYLMLDVDVKRLARICKKFIRDTLRKREHELTKEEKLTQSRLHLDQAVEGTKWCTRTSRAPHLQNLGDKEKLDACCRDLHKCPGSIPGFTYAHGFLNYLPWAIPECSCVEKFKKCLETEGSPEAVQFGKQLLDNFKLSCVQYTEKYVCTEHSRWLTKCIKTEKQNTAILHKSLSM